MLYLLMIFLFGGGVSLFLPPLAWVACTAIGGIVASILFLNGGGVGSPLEQLALGSGWLLGALVSLIV